MSQLTVEAAPVVGDEVFGIGGIVTACHAARVVVHADEVVDQRLVPCGTRDPGGQVEILHRELDLGAQLGPRKSRLGHEPFQVNDQDVGGRPQLELLASLAMLLTAWAVPRIILRQRLFAAELIEALVKGDALTGPGVTLGTTVDEGLVLDEGNLITGGSPTQIILRPILAKQSILGVLVPVQEDCFALFEQWRR